MIKSFKKIKKNGGAAMLISVVFFLFISLAIISGMVSPVVREFKIANDLVKSRQSLFLSESGLEDAYFRLKNSTPVGSAVLLSLNGNIAETAITDSGYNEKTIVALGDVALSQRKNRLVLTGGTGASFAYGVQSGTGGFVIGNSIVEGNVYSNGTITTTNGNALITGSAYAAGGLINDINIGTSGEGGDAWANQVTNSDVVGSLYCKTGSGNNKPCDTSKENPPMVNMPITQQMIDLWKSHTEGDIHTGNLTISTPTSLGGKRITGDLIINADLVLTDTVYVMGTISMVNGVTVSLSSSYGSTLGVLITDSPVNLSNNVQFAGSGSEGSYLMLLTTSSCPTTGCSSTNALEIANNVGAVILNAQNGTANIKNNIDLNELVANRIVIGNNAVITYLSGLANSTFTSGPQGGWNISSWEEVE